MVIFVSRFVFSPDGSVPQNYVDFKFVCRKIYMAMASSLKGENASQPILQDFSVHLLSDAGGGSLEEAHAIRQVPYLAAFIPPTPCVAPRLPKPASICSNRGIKMACPAFRENLKLQRRRC